MSNLICDICGTSYSASEDKCPTCGYARAFAESIAEEEPVPVVRAKVRGGRFSRKNVRKRMKQQEENGADPERFAAAPEIAFELNEAVADLDRKDPQPEETEIRISGDLPEEEPEIIVLPEVEMESEAAEPTEAEPAEAEEAEEEPIPVVILDLPETEQEQMGAEEEEAISAEEEQTSEEDAEAEDDDTVVPLILPVDTAPEEEMSPEEPEEEKKAMPIVRIALIAAAAALVILLLCLLLPRLSDSGEATQGVPETTEPTVMSTEEVTDAPTDAPTEAPTDPPTEPPTDPPTEAPTDPPTEPPTEAPTKPLLDVKLELNWYDLTFGATDQATRLKAEGIPSEDITWVSDDPTIAIVSEAGVITPVSGGRTTIRAIYGDQEAIVKVHCSF